MSILSFPRLNFKGVFNTNPCTCNNDDVMPDIVQRDIDGLGTNPIFLRSDTQVQEYLNESVNLENYGANPKTPTTPFMRSGWNLYGNHSTFFENTIITSAVVDPTSNKNLNNLSQDPIIGKAFRILGSPTDDPSRRGTPMIVDLDGTGLITTQLFIGGIEFGDLTNPITTMNADTRAFQDWLNFYSTVGDYSGEQNFVGIGCIMQFTIPSSAIPSPTNIASQILKDLMNLGILNEGLVIRFRIFECEPQLTDEMLKQEFSQGNQVSNPSLGYLVGTISVLLKGEAKTEPAGPGLRKLSAPYPRPVMSYKGNPLNPNASPQGSIPPANLSYLGPPALIGNTVASFTSISEQIGLVSLDLINCFPKDGFRHPKGPDGSSDGFEVSRFKADIGQIELGFVSPTTGTFTHICDIDYGIAEYSIYEDYGGIVDITFNSSLFEGIATGTLIVRGKMDSPLNAGTILLSEEVFRLVTDDRAIYMEEDKNSPNSTYSVGIMVFQNGGPTNIPINLFINEYANIIQIQPPDPPVSYRPNQTVGTDSNRLIFPSIVNIPAGEGYGGWFPIQINTNVAGAAILHYSLELHWDSNYKPSVPAWSTQCYSSIRVFAEPPSFPIPNPITWEFVYTNILRYYYLIFPFMSSIIPLNQADSIKSPFWSAKILERLNTLENPEKFYATTNMPVTRTMPPWKVNVLKQFINQK